MQPHGQPEQGLGIKIAVSFNLEQPPNLFENAYAAVPSLTQG